MMKKIFTSVLFCVFVCALSMALTSTVNASFISDLLHKVQDNSGHSHDSHDSHDGHDSHSGDCTGHDCAGHDDGHSGGCDSGHSDSHTSAHDDSHNAGCSDSHGGHSGPSPLGYLDTVNSTTIAGWACDASDYNAPLDIAVFDGAHETHGILVSLVAHAANQTRGDVAAICGGNANHGFTIPLPDSLKDAKVHDIHVYAGDVGGDGNDTELLNSPQPVAPAPVVATVVNNPYAWLDVVDQNTVSGWACDADNYNAAVMITIYDGQPGAGGALVGQGQANQAGQNPTDSAAIAVQCGGNGTPHRFSIATPASLKNGQPHQVYVYAVNIPPTGTDAQLQQSPMTFTGTAGPSGSTGAAPSTPTALNASCNAGNTATLSWTAPAGATSFDVRIVDVANGWGNQAAADQGCSAAPGKGGYCANTTSNPLTFNINNGHTYYWWMDAQGPGGVSSSVAGNSFSCGAGASINTGGAPTLDLKISPTQINQGEYTQLSWTSTNATACNLRWTGATTGTNGNNGTTFNHPVGSLSPGVHNFFVVCTGPNGTSDEKEVTVNVNGAAGGNSNIGGGGTAVLLPPSNLAVSCPTGNEATLSWDAPVYASGYRLFVVDNKDATTNWSNQSATDQGCSTAASKGGICDPSYSGTSKAFTTIPGHPYYWWLDAQGSVATDKPYSDAVHGPNFSCPMTQSTAPTNPLVSCSADGTSAHLSWTPSVGAVTADLRVSDNSNPWGDQTRTDQGCGLAAGKHGICDSSTSNLSSRDFSTIPGDTYTWWVHTRKADGVWTDAVHGQDFTCAAPESDITVAPSITSISPNPASVGARVTIVGTGFSSINNVVLSSNATRVGLLSGLPSSDGTTITFTVPSVVGDAYSYRQLAVGTYSISVTDKTGFSSNAVDLVIAAADTTSTSPTVNLSANPSVIGEGGTTNLSWTSRNVTSCTLSWDSRTETYTGAHLNVPVGVVHGLGVGSHTFSMVCTNAAGTASPASTATVNVTAGYQLSAAPQTNTQPQTASVYDAYSALANTLQSLISALSNK